MVSHRMSGRKFGRKTKHRIAMKRNLVSSLFEHGRITTTLTKAKEYRPHAERIISLARTKSLHNIRLAARDIHNKTVLKKLFEEIGPSFVDRPGGYTRIRKLATPRLNDGTPRAILELVTFVPKRAEVPVADAPKGGKAPKADDADEAADEPVATKKKPARRKKKADDAE